jgi:hypothetical protein
LLGDGEFLEVEDKLLMVMLEPKVVRLDLDISGVLRLLSSLLLLLLLT